MRNVLVVCDHVDLPPPARARAFDILEVNQYGPRPNLRLELWNVSHRLLTTLRPLGRDLLDIAAFVYHADNSVRRGTIRNVFNEDWVRDFSFMLPVRKPEVWREQSIISTLGTMLEFLTEDRFEFTVAQREPVPEQLAFKAIKEALPAYPEADCVSLFSGGMDSLVGAVHLYASGRRPLLVSHKSRPVLAHLQERLLVPLRECLPGWEFPHLGVCINRRGDAAVENSQRSRSFLYLALGALVAYELGLNELVVCENGITTFNLPRTGQTIGTQATRATHPRFVHLFRQLVSQVLQIDLQIQTPFVWQTRAELVQILKENSCAQLLPLTTSCGQSRRPKMYPHCGVCSQCVDRRFAVVRASLDGLDGELDGYEKDIFTGELNEGPERAQALSVVNFALDVQRRDPDSFCERYGEVYEAVDSLPGEPDRNLEAIYELHCRFADEIDHVISAEHARNWQRLYRRELPDSCLLMLTGPAAPGSPDPQVTQDAHELIDALRHCPVGKGKAFEDICEQIFSFLFCEGVPPDEALRRPIAQSASDQAYERRDLLFENRASRGFWKQMATDYDAAGVIVDSKNYEDELDGETVGSFSSKYLKKHGVGRFGIIVARRVPLQAGAPAARTDRVPSAVKRQKDEWRDSQKMILLLGEDDLVEMLKMKASGYEPGDLLRDRIFLLKSRM